MIQSRNEWEIKKADERLVWRLAEALGLREAVARVLVNRGIESKEAAYSFLYDEADALPDPFLLKGMDKAVERVRRAIDKGEKITVWGDYDVDGITSIALMLDFFRLIPYPIGFDIPRRFEDGYGFQRSSVEKLHKQGVTLAITVDNGIASIDEIAYAKSLGLDVIVIDHHELEEHLPQAYAVVDPKQPGCSFPVDNLAAAGLVFMFLRALRRTLVESGLHDKKSMPEMKHLLDLVALGTVADMAPLTGVNRLLVRLGLPVLSTSKRPGVMALKEVANLDFDADIDAFAISYQLAPRINAGGRLGEALAGVRLLSTMSLKEARQDAQRLNRYNFTRRKIEERMFQEAVEMIEKDKNAQNASVYILAKEGWHEGVIGLVASKIVDRFRKPAIILAISEEGTARGSGRSLGKYHLQAALMRHSDYFVRFGGHAMAAGLTIATEKIEQFKAVINNDAKDHLTEEDCRSKLTIDGECPLDEVDTELLEQLKLVSPYGVANPSPQFVARGVGIQKAMNLKQRHWKFMLKVEGGAPLDGISFNTGEIPIAKGDLLDIVYTPEYNLFRGRRSIQARILDFVIFD